MIISASRRTDLPAFYARWFIQRVRAGFCEVPNPFNPEQVTRVSLAAEDVDVIVFWTRNPRPLFPYLDELDQRGYRYYFQYTLMNNPRLIDPASPALPAARDTFRRLADHVGPQRVIWRYDPIVLSEKTPPDFHRQVYRQIAGDLRGYTRRSVISLMDVYARTRKRLEAMAAEGASLLPGASHSMVTGAWRQPPAASVPQDGSPMQGWVGDLMSDLAVVAGENAMEIVRCAEEMDLRDYGIRPGKCVDDEYIYQTFGLAVSSAKDPNQRKACGCVVSKDIGMYDSCLFGCQYCYATSSFARSRANYLRHDPDAPVLYLTGEKLRQISDTKSGGI